MTPEQYNATRGQGLTIATMDFIRAQRAAGVEVSMWSIKKHLCRLHGITDPEGQHALYQRVKTTVRALKGSNLVNVTREWRKDIDRTINIITLCSETL